MRTLESLIKNHGGWKKFKKKRIKYNYAPKTGEELYALVCRLIEERGVDADLNDINTSKITRMTLLMPSIFEGDCSLWNVSNVEYMDGMFKDCKNFNCDLSDWDVSKVKDMDRMFSGCSNFNCDLSGWNVENVEYHDDFAKNCPIDNTSKMPKFDN